MQNPDHSLPVDDYCGTTYAAKLLGLSVGTVQSLVERNELHAWKTQGGHRRISMPSIREYQRKHNMPLTSDEANQPQLKVLAVDDDPIVLEMLRVGQEVIVTFPNFGYWRNRIQITMGQMPVSKTLPYQWYDTPNVHLCTINDFDVFCKNHNIDILERKVITDGRQVNFMPNFLGSLAMYRLKNK